MKTHVTDDHNFSSYYMFLITSCVFLYSKFSTLQQHEELIKKVTTLNDFELRAQFHFRIISVFSYEHHYGLWKSVRYFMSFYVCLLQRLIKQTPHEQ